MLKNLTDLVPGAEADRSVNRNIVDNISAYIVVFGYQVAENSRSDIEDRYFGSSDLAPGRVFYFHASIGTDHKGGDSSFGGAAGYLFCAFIILFRQGRKR